MQQDNYWKCEYENLRRKKQKEKEQMLYKIAVFTAKTYDLLKTIGLTDEQIVRWYRDR